MTTEREHAAMEAAGLTDEQLSALYRAYRNAEDLDYWDFVLRQAVVDELENRARARFETTVKARKK